MSSQHSCQHIPTPWSLPAWDMSLLCHHCTTLHNSQGAWEDLRAEELRDGEGLGGIGVGVSVTSPPC